MFRFEQYAVAAVLLMAAAGFARGANADLILINGRIVTVDSQFSVRQAVALKSGRIVSTGASQDVLQNERGTATRVVDLQGRTVLPGLFDSHAHPLEAGLSEYRASIPTLDSFAAIQSYIRRQAQIIPKGQWIVVPRTFPTRLKEMRMPTKELLDAATEHPVMFDASYVVVVNSLGLKISGIGRDTPNPPRGEIVKDARGEPTGILKNAQSLLKGLKESSSFTDDEKADALEQMLKAYVATGITSVGDGSVQATELKAYRALQARHRLPLRVTMTAWYNAARPAEDILRDLRANGYATGSGDDWLRFGAFKMNVDGGMTIGTAYQRAPYGAFGAQLYGKTNPEDRGQLFESPDKLLTIFKAARDLGWQLSAHCQGGGAIDGFLDAMDALNREKSVSGARNHIIHGSFQSPEAIARMKRLGVLADAQPAWLYLDSEALEKVFGDDGMRYFFPLRSYLQAGIIVAGGSDHMIGHDKNRAVNPFNPFLGMWNAVARTNRAGHVIHPEECISREDALRMYTIWAARRHFAEKNRGSIEPGKYADLVVIDRDYLRCPTAELRDIAPVAVLVDGRFAFGTL